MIYRLTRAVLLCCGLSALTLFFTCTANAQQTGTPPVESGKLILEGIKHHDNGEYKVALATYRQIPEGDTNYALALNEMVLSSLADSSFKDAYTYSKAGLLLPQSPRHREFLLYLGHAYDYLGKHDSALYCYDSLIRANPYDHQPWYERGALFFQQKQYDSAIASFQHSLMLNPWHFRSHEMMGTALALQGRLTEGYLALCSSLLTTSKADQAGLTIGILSKITNGADEVANAYRGRPAKYVNPAYEEIDAIIAAKLAQTKDYKFNSELAGDAVINDLHAIMEKLHYDAGDPSFVMQYYVPLYTRMYKQDRFDPFVLQMFSGYGIESVDRLAKKQKGDVKDMGAEVSEYFDRIVSSQKLPFERGTDGHLKYALLPADEIFMKANVASKNPLKFGEGPATFYKSGSLYLTGAYNAEGHKHGPWKQYYANGTLASTVTYNDDKITGESKYFRENGTPSKVYMHDAAGEQTDESDYFYNGILNTKTIKSGGEPKLISYYPDGRIEYTAALGTDGKVADGVVKTYYNDGKPARIMHFAGGKRDGAYKEFYPNGKLSEQSNYRKGELDGDYASWFRNGQPHYKAGYEGGKLEGPFEEYNRAGKLIEKGAFHNGKKKGEYQYLHPETGKVYGTVVYKNDAPVAYHFTDASGKTLSEAEDGRRLEGMTFFYSNGNKESFVPYEDGKANGKATYYYFNGGMSKTTYYKDDKEEGLSTEYYLNGRKKSELNYKNGEADGTARYYYTTGKLSSEGYWMGGTRTGLWHSYYRNGRPMEEMFYVEGSLNGPNKNYHPNGRLNYTDYYDKGMLEAMVQYDTAGREKARVYYPQGNGLYTLQLPNGVTSFQSNLKNGYYEGSFVKYFPDGTLRERGYFRHGLHDSAYVSNFITGGVSEEGSYRNGERDGKWTSYERTGELDEETWYEDGQREGPHRIYDYGILHNDYMNHNGELDSVQTFYGEDGKVSGLLRYSEGTLTGYASAGADGKPLQWMPVVNGTARIATTYPNGAKGVELNFDRDGYEGTQKFFYSNGRAEEEISYKEQSLDGAFKKWNAAGNPIHECTYSTDELNGTVMVYDKAGALLTSLNYGEGGLLHGPCTFTIPKTGKKITVNYYYGYPASMK